VVQRLAGGGDAEHQHFSAYKREFARFDQTIGTEMKARRRSLLYLERLRIGGAPSSRCRWSGRSERTRACRPRRPAPAACC
jgi:hypothetical protein